MTFKKEKEITAVDDKTQVELQPVINQLNAQIKNLEGLVEQIREVFVNEARILESVQKNIVDGKLINAGFDIKDAHQLMTMNITVLDNLVANWASERLVKK